MKNILLIGVGGTGSKTVDILSQKVQEFGKLNDNNIQAVVFDTDEGDIKKIEWATPIPMADNASVGTICDRIGSNFIREWFPYEDKAIRSQEMFRGASQWRKKSYLAFLNTMNKPKYRSTFINMLEKMTLDPNAPCEVYVITSVAGGTGSGSFIPIALFAKRYLRKNLGKSPIINAMIALPDIYAEGQTPENAVKIYANAYAIFRELNAINLVSRGYNKGEQLNKKAPVKMTIGHPNEPNVGLLFDSMDSSFWTPDAAPFNQVFVLDKIPNVTSVVAHNMVLANSLYSLICTDIGDKFDSEISNHELVHSQNNGSGAIYAGISTSEIRFPRETILDYIAHEKTIEACEGDMLSLHKAVESKIKENEREYKEMGRAYNLGDTGYADIVLEELLNDVENKGGKINDIVERGTSVYDNEGNRDPSTNTAEVFFKKMEKEIRAKIPKYAEHINKINVSVGKSIAEATSVEEIQNCAALSYKEVKEYFISCVDAIKRMKTSLTNSILFLDAKDGLETNSSISLINEILKHDKKYIHPVAALVQLCRFKKKLFEATKKENEFYADAIKSREIEEVPGAFFKVVDDPTSAESNIKIKMKKSAYYKMGEKRFFEIIKDSAKYVGAGKSDLKTDAFIVGLDAEATLKNIFNSSISELKAIVYANLNKAVDILIDKYRSFFTRFDKEKENLIEQTKDVLRKDGGTQDSIINVYSSQKDKEKILKDVLENAGPATAQEIDETNDIIGKGVFEAAFASACAEVSQSEDFNDKDVSVISSLFGNMINSYKKTIKSSDAFSEIYNANVVEAIKMSFADQKEKAKESIKSCFANASESARPSVKIDTRDNIGDIVKPAYVTVFMMSTNTARFIKKNAAFFEVNVPTDQNKESKVLEACAEQFIGTFASVEGARVAIVDDMHDNVMYCTSEVMDVSPLRIAKFNELGEDNVYFTHYQQAIRNCKAYETEMWNPHLGNNLHLRGYLPYMNEAMEKIYDDKMVKALLFGLWHDERRIVYSKRKTAGKGTTEYMFYLIDKEGRQNAIRTPEGNEINLKNISQLIKWFRNQDELIEDWSKKFDDKILAIKNEIPNIPGGSMIGDLKTKITACKYMNALNYTLFKIDNYVSNCKPTFIKVHEKKSGPSIMELANLVKLSEESGRDCDDAERIITVAYDVFLDICKFRANPKLELDNFLEIYDHNLNRFVEGLLQTKTVLEDEDHCDEYIDGWLQTYANCGCFKAMSEAVPFTATGELNMNDVFRYGEDSGCAASAAKKHAQENRNKTAKNKAKNDESVQAESAEVANQEVAATAEEGTSAPAEGSEVAQEEAPKAKKGPGRPAGTKKS